MAARTTLLCVMPRRFTLAHAWVACVLFVVFAALTAWATNALLSMDANETRWEHLGRVALTVFSTPLGPMTGPIARQCQTCCLENGLELLGPAALLLAGGVLLQLLPPARGRAWQVVRFVVWGLGWFAWFGSGIVSLGHALE